MKKMLILFLIIITIFLALVFHGKIINNKIIGDMKLSSSAFDGNRAIPVKYTCQGSGINPPLMFNEIPKDAKSLALILEDPDAPGGTFVHWVIYNIPPNEKGIGEGMILPNKEDGINSTGKTGFIAPCPPSGTHHYNFKLYALDNLLNIQDHPDRDMLLKSMDGHILDQTELVGLYGK